MRYYVAISVDNKIVSCTGLADSAANPYTPQKLLDSEPVGVRSLEVAQYYEAGHFMVDAQDVVIPDTATPAIAAENLDMAYVDNSMFIAALMALVDTMNARLPVDNQITKQELRQAFKARRGHTVT